MSNVNISLTANTASYVQRLKDAKTQTDRNLILMERRIDQFARDVNNNFTSVDGSINAMISGLARMKGGGYVAALLALSVALVSVASGLHQVSQQSLEAEKNLKRYADQARMSTEDFKNMSRVLSTVGLDMEKMGDISKDIFDKLGEYTTNGEGAFKDFFDVVGYGEDKFKKMRSMNAEQIIMYMANELERANASGEQFTQIFEAIGSDLSYVLPLIKQNGKAYQELHDRMKQIGQAPLFNKDAKEELQVLSESWETMWNSMGVVAGNKLEGLFSQVNGLLASTIEWLGAIDRADKAADKAKATRNRARNGTMEFVDYNNIEKGELIDRKFTNQAAIDMIKAQMAESEKMSKLWYSDKGQNKKRLADNKAALKLLEEENKAIITNLKLRDEATLKKNEKDNENASTQVINSKRLRELQAQADAINDKTTQGAIAKANAEHTLKLAQIKERGDTEGLSVETINALKVKAEQDLQTKLASIRNQALQKNIQQDIDSVDDTTEQGKIDKELLSYDLQLAQLEQRIRDENMLQDDANAIREQKEREHQKRLLQIKQDAEIERLQLAVDSATSESERQKAQYALETAMIEHQAQNSVEAEKAKGGMLFNAKLENHMAEFDLDTQYRNQNEFLAMERAQAELEFLKEEYNNKAIGHEEFLERKRKADEAYNIAKADLDLKSLGLMQSSFASMASMMEEGSKAQKAALAAEKAAALASMSIQQWEQWGKAESWPEKAMVIASYTAGIASLAATSIGQFHSGTDEVDQTGSYILKAGERVVQESANKDLTAYLNANKAGGASGATINAPLNIQGDTTISESKLLAMNVKQRHEIAKLVKMAQREDPRLR